MKRIAGTTIMMLLFLSMFSVVLKAEKHGEIKGMELNDGKRWEANKETTSGIKNMEKLVIGFTKMNDVKEYKDLTEKLNEEFQGIFDNCTMTGTAHDQLHNYLVPIIDYLKDLKSDDLKECKDSYGKLKVHLAEYDKYFK